MIPESAVRDIVRQIVGDSLRAGMTNPREWLICAMALREAFSLATAIWDGPEPLVFVLFTESHARLLVRARLRDRKSRGPGRVLPFLARTKPGFGRGSRAVAR